MLSLAIKDLLRLSAGRVSVCLGFLSCALGREVGEYDSFSLLKGGIRMPALDSHRLRQDIIRKACLKLTRACRQDGYPFELMTGVKYHIKDPLSK